MAAGFWAFFQDAGILYRPTTHRAVFLLFLRGVYILILRLRVDDLRKLICVLFFRFVPGKAKTARRIAQGSDSLPTVGKSWEFLVIRGNFVRICVVRENISFN